VAIGVSRRGLFVSGIDLFYGGGDARNEGIYSPICSVLLAPLFLAGIRNCGNVRYQGSVRFAAQRNCGDATSTQHILTAVDHTLHRYESFSFLGRTFQRRALAELVAFQERRSH
jgi:hypothetical protein